MGAVSYRDYDTSLHDPRPGIVSNTQTPCRGRGDPAFVEVAMGIVEIRQLKLQWEVRFRIRTGFLLDYVRYALQPSEPVGQVKGGLTNGTVFHLRHEIEYRSAKLPGAGIGARHRLAAPDVA